MPESLTSIALIQPFFGMVSFLFSNGFRDYVGMISFNLFWTLVIELILAIILGVRNKEDLLLVFEVNCLTNPIAVTILFFLTRSSVGTVTEQVIVLFIEAVVVVTEGMIYKRRLSEQKRNPFLLSFILNAASYGTGIALELLSVPV